MITLSRIMHISFATIVRSVFLYACVSYLYHETESLGIGSRPATPHRLPPRIRSLEHQPDAGRSNKPLEPSLEPPVKRKKNALICYYDNQTMRSVTRNRLLAEDIDSTLCTHLIYRHGEFSVFEDGVWWPTESEADFERASLKALKSLRHKNPDLKILLSLGGYKSGGESLEDISKTPQSRQEFIGNSTEFLIKFQLDGISLAWSFRDDHLLYNQQYLQQTLKGKFTNLLRDLRKSFDARKFLLTSQISAKKSAIDSGYDIPQMSRYLDYIILDAHHFDRYDTQQTGPNSALYHSKDYDLNEEDARNNVNWSVNYLLEHGAPRDKLILGISLEGVVRKLEDSSKGSGYNAPTSEIRKVRERNSHHTRHEWADKLSYEKICEKLKVEDANWSIVRDSNYRVPYATRENQWISYEDIVSVMQKARYATSMGLAGVSVFSLDRDDYAATCHPETFPLTRAAKVALNMPIITKPPVQTTTRPPVRAATSTKPPVRVTTTTARSTTPVEDDDMMMGMEEEPTTITSRMDNTPEEDDMTMDTTTEATRTTTTTRKPTQKPTREREEAEVDEQLLKIPVNPKAPEVTLRETARLIQRVAEKKCAKMESTVAPDDDDHGMDEDHTHKPDEDHTHRPDAADPDAGEGSTTTEEPQGPPVCPDSRGLKQLPGPGCRKYFDCSSGELELKVCRDDLVWNRELGYCDERDNVANCKA